MPMVWNDQADIKLFMAVLSTTNPKLNYQKLADIMGPGCSASAIQHRIQRLKVMVASKDNAKTNNSTKDTNAAEATEPATTSAPSSPEQTKKKRGRPAKKIKDTDEPAPKQAKKGTAKKVKAKAKTVAADSGETEDA